MDADENWWREDPVLPISMEYFKALIFTRRDLKRRTLDDILKKYVQATRYLQDAEKSKEILEEGLKEFNKEVVKKDIVLPIVKHCMHYFYDE